MEFNLAWPGTKSQEIPIGQIVSEKFKAAHSTAESRWVEGGRGMKCVKYGSRGLTALLAQDA